MRTSLSLAIIIGFWATMIACSKNDPKPDLIPTEIESPDPITDSLDSTKTIPVVPDTTQTTPPDTTTTVPIDTTTNNPPPTPPVTPPNIPTDTTNTDPPGTTPPPPPPASSNPLDNLPPDTGGAHNRHILGTDSSPYGYYLYTPSGYQQTGTTKFPLLIFLHGSGQIGNSRNNPAELDKVLRFGPPDLIDSGVWKPKYPMIVASPQCHDGWWDPYKIEEFTEFMMERYKVDTLRIYMTGLSMGGFEVWDQVALMGKYSHITAAVPIAGGGTADAAKARTASQFPIWAFHGANDVAVPPDFVKQMKSQINALNPAVKMKLTIFPNTDHDNTWQRVYQNNFSYPVDPAQDPFNMNVYEWLLQFHK